MFRAVIRSTQLTSDVANSFFRIRGECFQNDFSFVSTLRALVAPRMKDDDEAIYLAFKSGVYSSSSISRAGAHNACRSIATYIVADEEHERHGKFYVHSFTSSDQSDNYAALEALKCGFEGAFPGWHRIEKVTLFFKNKFYCLCFINPTTKSVVIFVDNLDIRKMHYLQCGIFAFLPWYFDPSEGVTELEKELVESLRENTSTKYEDCIARIAEKYDFRTESIKMLLEGFETRYERQRRNEIRQDIDSIIYNIKDLNDRIGQYLSQKNDLDIELLGLDQKIANGGDGNSEIMEYFLCNRNIVLESVTDSRMTFSCKGYLEYFDEEMAKRMIDNPHSCIYEPNGRPRGNIIAAEDMKLLMNALFVDQTLKMKFCASYTFNLNGNVSANSHHTYGSEFRDCTPNTHIDKHSCMGNYYQAINQILSEKNYIGAIEQCVASCKSLNFADGVVLEEFMARLYEIEDRGEVNLKCIELPDGQIVTPKGAIDYLKTEETGNEQTDQNNE